MSLAVDVVIGAMMALMVLLLVAGAEARWRRRGRRAKTHAPRPTAGPDRMPAAIHPARRRPVGRQVSGAPGLAHAPRLPRRPAAGVARGLSTIVAVYRTSPVMVVGETARGALLECSLPDLAARHERLPPRLWQALVERYQVFQVR
jgi:hypothetical protein